MGDNGKLKKEDSKQGAPKQDEGHLGVIRIGDKDVKVLNTATMIEIRVHKLENGKEVSQVIAHEFMMTDHKQYMVRLLTDAIMTVMRATKRENMVKLASEAMFNKLRRQVRARPRIRDIFKRKR